MVDQFAIVLTHGLMALAALRLFMRDELDRDPAEGERAGRTRTPDRRA